MMRLGVFFPYFLLVSFLPFAHTQEGQFDLSGRKLPVEKEDWTWVRTLFEEDSLLKIEIRSDFTSLLAEEGEPDYQPAELLIRHGDSVFTRASIRLRSRGNSRRDACPFPPLKLDFTHSGTDLDSLRRLDELKMVCLCRQGAEYESFLLKEFLVYKLYNLLTPLSFQVRLVRASYFDGEEKIYENPAFLIEEVDLMARRNGGVEVEEEDLEPSEVDHFQLGLLSVFQFMIANLDWSVPGLHNLKAVRVGDRLYPIPYDFDFSEMVGAFYASRAADPNMPEMPVNRVYRGNCLSQPDLEKIVARFEENRMNFDTIINTFQWLSPADRKKMQEFLNSFYRIMSSPSQRETYFSGNCP